MIHLMFTPPSSSGLGYLVLSQGTGVRVPVGVLRELAVDTAHVVISVIMIAIELYGVPRLRVGHAALAPRGLDRRAGTA